MSSESDSGTIFYASVSHATTVLADFLPPAIVPSGGGGGDLAALAATCLEASPHFHLLYTHTANRRIYAFLMSDRVLFFAIADDSLGRSTVLLFLHRLREATIHSALRRVISGDPLPRHCLQHELLPVIRRLVASFFTRSPSKEEKPSPSPPHALPSPVISSTPPSSDSHLLTGDHRRKIKKERKKNPRSEEVLGVSLPGNELEVSVLDNAGDADLESGSSGGRKSLQRIWKQQVRLILVIDAVVCTLLFGIWLSVCKGFQCIV
ncbi:hypothetical protein KSP40_PGU019969 [Platanthera guangdongensis]|uniref:Longin domain-containing protein n=1 Tax=Platanthera guangdongensis TaxID=2320717 RepID=A0ABR2LG15_9ASPA